MNNIFLTDTRVYIAGVLLPVVEVNISSIPNAAPTASITLLADHRLIYVGENDRVPVMIFQRESMVGSNNFILLFEGYIAGRLYMNTALQRTMTFQAIGVMDILHDVRLMYMRTLDDMSRPLVVTNEQAALAPGSFFDPQYFFMQGLNPGKGAIRFPYQYIENVYKFMGDPGIGESSETKNEHNSNLSEYYRKMHKLYNMDKRYLRVPLYDENSSGTTIWTGYAENAFPLLRGLQNSTAVSLLSPFIANHTPESQTLWDLLTMVSGPMDFEINLPAAPAYIDGCLGSSILKPNFCDSIPPRCNVLFRSQIHSISQDTVYKGMPTRVLVHDVNSPAALIREQAPDLNSYFERLLTIFYPQRNVPSTSLDNRAANPFATSLLDTENYTGPWIHEVNTPVWWQWTEPLKFTKEATSEPGNPLAFESARQALSHRQLVLARYMRRTLTVRSVFNPYVAVGYPGVVFDAEDTGLSFAGYVTGVSHVISATGMETQVAFSFVRPLDEAVVEQIVSPLPVLMKLLGDKELMTTVYSGLLGDKPAVPAAEAVNSRPVNVTAVPSAQSGQTWSSTQGSTSVLPPNADAGRALSSAISRANDPRSRYVLGSKGYWNPNTGNIQYDCSGLMQCALQDAGFRFSKNLCTANMHEQLTRAGLSYTPGVNTSALKPGDILCRPTVYGKNSQGKTIVVSMGHTEMVKEVLPNGRIVTVGAHNSKLPPTSQVSPKDYSSRYVTSTYSGVFRIPTTDSNTLQQQPQASNNEVVQPPTAAAAESSAAQPQNTERTPSKDEQEVLAAQQKNEIEEAQAQAATTAGSEASAKPQEETVSIYKGSEAMTYKELLDLYTIGTEDRLNPQRNIDAAYALQRRNICTFDQFVEFSGLTVVRGTPVAHDVIPVCLNGAYTSDRNKVHIYVKTRVKEAAENQDNMNKNTEKEQQQSQGATQATEQPQPTKTEAVNRAEASVTAGEGVSPNQVSVSDRGDTIGAISRFLESGGNSAAIGYDPGGGTSYGKYQIASRLTKYGQSSLTAVLNWMEKNGGANGREIASRMRAAGGYNNGGDTGSDKGSAPAAWKQLAAEGKFGDLEHRALEQLLYKPTRTVLGKQDSEVLAYIDRHKTTQDVMWSTANGHGPGPAATLLRQAYAECKSSNDMSEERFLTALYARRAGCYENNSDKIKKAMPVRYAEELALAKDAVKRERETGEYRLDPSVVPRMAGHGTGYRNVGSGESGSTGSWANIGTNKNSNGVCNPMRDQIDNNIYTYTAIIAGDQNYKIEDHTVAVQDLLKEVAQDAFAKQIYA